MSYSLPHAIRLAVGVMAGTIALAQAQEVTLPPLLVDVDSGRFSTESTPDYTIPAMNSATGLSLSAQETPQAVSVVTSQQMQDQNITTLKGALDSTVGVSTSNFDRGRANFSSRGFAIDKYQVDGMNVNWSGQWVSGESTLDTALFDRVEIVRGASGLTNGAGNPSAAVNLVRKHAHSSERETAIEGGVGRHGDLKATIDHSQPLNHSATVRGRVIASYQGGDTFVDRESNKQGTLYGVIDADITPTTHISGGISHQRNDRDSAMWGGLPAFFDDGSESDWSVKKNASTDWSYWNSKTTNYFLEGKQTLGENWHVSLKANYRDGQGDSKLFYFSGNSVNRADGLGWTPSPGQFHVENTQSNIQLQVDGKFQAWGQEHDVIVGGQHSRLRRHADQWSYDNVAPASNFFNWDGSYPEPNWIAAERKVTQSETETGLYAASRLKITDQLAVVAGARLSNWKMRGDSYGTTTNYEAKNVFTPYAGILYDITPEQTLYASYTDIFKPQSQRDIHNNVLDPIEGASYEIGWKGSFLDNRLHTQAAVFRTEQDNLAQVDGSNTIIGITPETQAYYAAKGARVNGFELEASGDISSTWRLGAGYSQWRGKDASGNPLNTTSPRKQFKAFATYDASAITPGLTLGAGVKWQNGVYSSASHTPTNSTIRYGQGSYAIVDVMARYQINDNFSAQFNVDNLFNKKYRNQFGWGHYGYGDPRYISASFRYDF